MSTSAIINFCEGNEVVARIYRHSDGYPGENGVDYDLERFFQAVEDQCNGDTRFDQADYLAAKYVVWQANENSGEPGSLDFLSIGIIVDNVGADYNWFVTCSQDGERPKIRYERS